MNKQDVAYGGMPGRIEQTDLRVPARIGGYTS
jgi:hypothetical protein